MKFYLLTRSFGCKNKSNSIEANSRNIYLLRFLRKQQQFVTKFFMNTQSEVGRAVSCRGMFTKIQCLSCTTKKRAPCFGYFGRLSQQYKMDIGFRWRHCAWSEFKQVLLILLSPPVDPVILNGIDWSTNLTEAFIQNRKEYPDIYWQSYGSQDGFLRTYPLTE